MDRAPELASVVDVGAVGASAGAAMTVASIEVSVQPPDLLAAVCLAGAVVAIDLAALRFRRATVSRWVRHQVRHRPAAALTIAALLALHLIAEVPIDPLRWAAGMAARQTGDTHR